MLLAMEILFGAGVLFCVGPTALSYILTGFSAVEPVSGYVTAYLAVTLLLYIFLNRMHRRTFRIPKPHDPKLQRKLRTKRARLVKIMTAIQWIAIMSIILMAFHGLFVKANTVWLIILSENEEIFSKLRYVGIVLIAISVGFRIGIKMRASSTENGKIDCHTEKKERIDGYTETVRNPEVVTDVECPIHESKVKVVDFASVPFSRVTQEVTDENLSIHLPEEAETKLR